jgi:isohexenylglutaconyl-CoA hydratase
MIHTLLHQGVLFVTLNRPEARNALGDAMLDGLEQALERTARESAVRAMVLRGAGGHFCAGGDFAQFKALMATEPADPDPIARVNRRFGRLLEGLLACEVPVLAMVQGAAVGGGFGLAAACDVVLATTDARFSMPELGLGLPPAQIAPFVARRLGTGAALRLMLSGERLDAAQAQACGLVDEMVDAEPALREAAGRWLARWRRAEPGAVRATRRILAAAAGGPLAGSLDLAAREFAACLRSGSAAEGLAALSGRRDPAWASHSHGWPELP